MKYADSDRIADGFGYLAIIIAILAVVFGFLFFTKVVFAWDEQEDQVTICHRTNSVTNPYEQITVDESAVDGEGENDHTSHTGPVATSESVAQALKDDKENWGDIIPNVLNWTTEGQAVYNNDCEYIQEEEPTPPPPPVATHSATPSSTPKDNNPLVLPNTNGVSNWSWLVLSFVIGAGVGYVAGKRIE